MVQNTGLKPFSARKQAVIHQGKSRGFILKLVKNTREKLVLPRKIFARGRFHLLENVLCESLVNDVGLGKQDLILHFPRSSLFETSFLTDDTNVNLERIPFNQIVLIVVIFYMNRTLSSNTFGIENYFFLFQMAF